MGAIVNQDALLVSLVLRETIMQYFKGTCVVRLVRDDNVHTTSAQERTGDLYYQRREAELQDRRKVYYDGIGVMYLSKNPQKVEFIDTLKVSDMLEQVEKELRKFMREYLPAVEVEIDYANNR